VTVEVEKPGPLPPKCGAAAEEAWLLLVMVAKVVDWLAWPPRFDEANGTAAAEEPVWPGWGIGATELA